MEFIKMKKKVLAVIQARMGGSRLPRKTALPLVDGKVVLELMLERVKKCRNIDKLIVATTINHSDNRIVEICKLSEVECFRGNELDVLDRFYQAYRNAGNSFNTIVRLTGDCPLHDPAIIDKVISVFLESDAECVTNVDPPTYPDGLDTEVFSAKALEKAWHEAKMKSEREHVTQYIRNNPAIFKKINVANDMDLSALRWTLDEESDYKMIKSVYENLYGKNPFFGMKDILNFLSKHPEIGNLNIQINRNEGLMKSLREDKKVIS